MTNAQVPAGAADLTPARVRLIVFSLFLLQGLIWVILPLLFDGSIRRDVTEAIVDGPAWQLSYLRHPPMSSWLAGLAWETGPFRYVTLFTFGWLLASGAFVVLALFLARDDKPMAGIVALLAGLASPFATYIPLNLNHNITVMFFWALSLAASWRAFSRGSIRDWLLLGAVVGFGLWAKYALLHVMLPLVALFFLVPEWRRQIAKPGPWLAVLLCTAIIAPHLADVLAKGLTPLQFAIHASPASFGQRLAWAAEFALNCTLSQICMAGLAVAAAGLPALDKAWRQLRDWRTATRFEQFLNVAAVAPAAIVLAATLFEVRPHFLWQTPFNIGFAAFWGHVAAHAGTEPNTRRLARVYAALACLLIVSFVVVREVAPLTLRRAANQELNGPELASLAESYWAKRHSGKIRYIVTLNERFGFQAAGSITFDLPYRVHTLEDGDPGRSAWIDVEALKREGALVVMTQPPAPGQTVLGQPIENVETFARPVLRGARPPAILFGELRGTSKQAAQAAN